MVGRDTCFTHEQAAPLDKLVVTIDPDIEILVCLIARERNVHTLDNVPPLGVENRRVRRMILAEAARYVSEEYRGRRK